MSEYELHQLAAGSRYEFDGATLAYMAWALLFLFFSCRERERWSAATGWALAILFLAGAGLLVLRCVAAMGRYGKQIALLSQLHSKYVLANPVLQLPTLVIRTALFVIAPLVVIYFIRLAVRRSEMRGVFAASGNRV